jgi:hypothetical protein
MSSTLRSLAVGLTLALPLLAANAVAAEAQGRGNGARPSATADVSLSVQLQTQIREFYAARPSSSVEALPPGIRRNLQRGKPMPPGIAKKAVPGELQARVGLADGYELVEVGLDVFLVEVATNIIHDVLMDVIR